MHRRARNNIPLEQGSEGFLDSSSASELMPGPERVAVLAFAGFAAERQHQRSLRARERLPQGGVVSILGLDHVLKSLVHMRCGEDTSCRDADVPGEMAQLLGVVWMTRGDVEDSVDCGVLNQHVGAREATADKRLKVSRGD